MSALAKPVLVVDDEADIRDLLELTLGRMGLEAVGAASVAEARARIGEDSYSLCLTDMRLPDGDGLELVHLLAEVSPGTPVAVITAHGSAENAVAALKAGAFDYLSKPVSLAQLRDLVKAALRASGSQSGRKVQSEPDPPALAGLIGSSALLERVREMIMRLARSQAPVYVTGESGTGKELAARAIHGASARALGPFVGVNCGAIPENLMESEFFGYRKGAFTGANQDRDGFFQAATGGTLFLDEVADLPLQMQVKLLRTIQEKKVRRVGETTEDNVDVRIISATHQNLGELVQRGLFRQDLYYRLNVIELRMPALRDMPEDVPGIARTLLRRLAEETSVAAPLLTSEAIATLQGYDFPGNVRELENLLERALALCNGREIRRDDLLLGNFPIRTQTDAVPLARSGERDLHEDLHTDGSRPALLAPLRDAADPAAPEGAAAGLPECPLPEYLDLIERRAIEAALTRTRFNKTAAARLLGITFRALRYRMERLGIE